MSDITASIATAIQAKTGGNVEGEIPEWWAEFIDMVLAELQSTGCLIPAGGMALTAEQVAALKRLMDAQPDEVPQGYDLLESLFPATDPAEEAVGDPLQAWKEFLKPKPIGWYRTMTPQFATEHFGFPGVIGSKGFWTHTASDGGKWAWGGDEWELREYPPAPAEPAEEETKAEAFDVNALVDQVTQAAWNERKRTKEFYGYDSQDWDELPSSKQQIEYSTIRGALTELQRLGLLMLPAASSPVVPAPTETGPQTLEGPWDRIEDIPKTVGRVTDRDGDAWEWDGDNWVTPETAILPTTYINRKYAPFVAAEEG